MIGFLNQTNCTLAHQLRILPRLGQKGVIGNNHSLIERTLVGSGDLTTGQKDNELSPVEVRVIQKPIIGIFVCVDEVLKEPAGPQS